VEAHEGPRSARRYQFVAKGITGSLVRVGAGASNARASLVARDRAHRFRTDAAGEPRRSKHGQLVADWVEVFAPVIYERLGPQEWPGQGTLLLDHLPFRVSAFHPTTGKPIPAGVVAFDVFCAAAFDGEQWRIWRLEAFTDAGTPNWQAFLWSLPGQPPRVVCDAHSGMTKAIQTEWPTTEIYLCEWHLKKALRRLLHKWEKRFPTQVAAVLPRIEAGFTGLSFWDPFVADAHAAGIPALDKWLHKNAPIIKGQFQRRGWRRDPNSTPLTTSALEALCRPIRDAIHPRRYSFKNRERLNRLLMLMALHQNGLDDELAYTDAICQWLIAAGGTPTTPRRAVSDPNGSPSLRA
jgi:hypothetical protein